MSLLQTVLFADISRSSRLYEVLGDEAAKAIIESCLAGLIEITCQHHGRLVKIIGDEIMAIFPDADETVRAAFKMQEKVTHYATSNNLKMGLRIGLNFGPIIHENDDVFGSTVNAAARMVAFAQSGQIITNHGTVKVLADPLQAQTRLLERIPSPGKTGRMSVYQIIWEQRELTSARTYISTTTPLTSELHLQYHDQSLQLQPEQSGFTIGRNDECNLMVRDDYTSRQHAQIIVRKGKFVYIDQSTNGTFIVLPDDIRTFIQREEYSLQNRGWIGLGELRLPDHPDAIYFEVLDVPETV
jgi:adenylate cyclase